MGSDGEGVVGADGKGREWLGLMKGEGVMGRVVGTSLSPRRWGWASCVVHHCRLVDACPGPLLIPCPGPLLVVCSGPLLVPCPAGLLLVACTGPLLVACPGPLPVACPGCVFFPCCRWVVIVRCRRPMCWSCLFSALSLKRHCAVSLSLGRTRRRVIIPWPLHRVVVVLWRRPGLSKMG